MQPDSIMAATKRTSEEIIDDFFIAYSFCHVSSLSYLTRIQQPRAGNMPEATAGASRQLYGGNTGGERGGAGKPPAESVARRITVIYDDPAPQGRFR